MLNYKQNWYGIKPTKWLIKFSLTIYIMLKKLSGNLLTGSKYVTVETKADVQFDRPNLKQTKINVHNVMPLHIKQKAKVDIQTPNPNQHACISSITAPLFQRSPYYLLLQCSYSCLTLHSYSQQWKTYRKKRLLLTYFIPKIRPYNTT